ncbi:GreA/GreB family elongation factor [Prosthecobacter sp.]|uniref:GreA/GreB family elongation factor n=1 Tax=Prosthecobacter sp. TaxID=1965333 RepID=UPI003782F3AB
MSRAFVKEDIDVPDRPARRRSASGLPPGALNYLTAAGAQRLQLRLVELQASPGNEVEAEELQDLLGSATIVQPSEQPDTAVFGVRVTLRSEAGEMKSLRIVGVDEVNLEPDQVSWVSPAGKALLGARVGQRVSLEPPRQPRWTVTALE